MQAQSYLREVIHHRDGLVVEHIKQCAEPGSAVIFTFTERGNTDLSGLGFGGKFLLDLGYDVIAIKSGNCTWFEEITSSVAYEITRHLVATRRHQTLRVGYGSSMGGYAAIRYSNWLELDRVIAISPLCLITDPKDTRFAQDKNNMQAPPMINQECVRSGALYNIIFDPKNIDAYHVEKLQQIMQPQALRLLKFPYSGHPSGFFLQEAGILKSLVTQLIAGDDDLGLTLGRGDRSKSSWYLTNLAMACSKSRKFSWALELGLRALQLEPRNPELHTLMARVYCGLGQLPDAQHAATVAIALDPRNTHRKLGLVDILALTGSYAAAIELLDSMIESAPVDYYVRRRRELAAKLRP